MPYIYGNESYFDEANNGFDSFGLSSNFKVQRDLVSFGKLSANDMADWYQLSLNGPGNYTLLVSTDPVNNYSQNNQWHEHAAGIAITITDRFGVPIAGIEQGFADLSSDGELRFEYTGNAGTDDLYVRITNLSYASTDYVISLEAHQVAGLDLFGSYWDDYVRTSAGDDYIETYSGDDTIINSAGNDYFNGGSGVDALVMSGRLDEYRLSGTSNNLVLQDKLGEQGNDHVQNIERLIFSDYALAFDFDGSAGQAYRLYLAAFNRSPDLEGLGYWINKLDHGMDLERVAEAFYRSDEFASRYGTHLSNANFVTTLYQNVLHRLPDSGGFDYWNYKLSSGQLTRAEVLLRFSESAEHQIQVIGQTQNGIEYLPW